MATASVQFVALGGVWLDEIRGAGKATRTNVVGGSVTFATLGARLFAAGDPTAVRLVFIAGNDFPQDVISTFRSWRVALTVHHSESFASARGVIEYDGIDESRRTYQRLTSPLQTTWEYLTIPTVLNATCFHLFENPKDAKMQSQEIISQRRGTGARPLFIWEPQGKSCNNKSLDSHIHAASLMDVFSPNSAELEMLFEEKVSRELDKNRIEDQARSFINVGIGYNNRGCIVVRCAEHGCLVMSRDIAPTWLPAFFGSASEKVVDATGGGNAFLGGFGAGYQETGSFVEAAKYGNVAASFVIEQAGVPNVSGEGEAEVWNGENVRKRLAMYQARLHSSHI